MPTSVSDVAKVSCVFIASYVELDFWRNGVAGLEVLMTVPVSLSQGEVELRAYGDDIRNDV